MQIKLMTFNTQHCMNYRTREIDFDVMANAIARNSPDILVLNEMRGEGPDPEYTPQAETLAARLGYGSYFSCAYLYPNGGPYGNALLSRFPIVSVETVQVPDPEHLHSETRAFLRARLALPDGNSVTVLGTHFGLHPDQHHFSVETFGKVFVPERCILMGDFNVHPDNPVLKPIRERMNDAGALLPEGTCTFPSDEPCKKIDYIFCTPDIRILAAEVPAIIASDHRPHTALIEL